MNPLSNLAVIPIATVTDLITRGLVLDALITVATDEFHVYSWAVS